MVIVFHFTCKLMDLGIPDVDAQNPLWSPSGDLSSLGCLWCTRISAEVICELLHTKSRFLREEAQAHTHPHPSPGTLLPFILHLAPACRDLRKIFSYPSSAGQAAKARQGLLLRAELCVTCSLSLIPGSLERGVGAAVPHTLLRQSQTAGEMDVLTEQPSPWISPGLPIPPVCRNSWQRSPTCTS